jgi:hypothetical protein
MNGWIRRSQGAKGMFALLLLCALAIRVAIPTGFMPTQSVHGLVITLCTGEGAVKATLPIQKDDAPGDHQGKPSDCAFAVGLGGGMIAPPDALLRVDAPLPPVPPTSRAIADLTVHRLAAPPPPAQGPPARA